jgi:ABC-type antimicrobial peptide transport system permease subunit
MARIVEATLGQPRFHSALLSGFAFAALVLACVGIYGVMAQTVAARARELAVRAAMGATRDALQGLILRQTAIVTGMGLIAGLLGMSVLTRLLGTMLYEVSASDPKTLIAAVLAVVAVALLAAYVPARRAGRADPVALLRQE